MHHTNTPKTVLDAPKQTVAYLHEHTGANRRERRHGYTHDTGKHYIIPKEYREEATNEPYRKATK